MKPYLVCLAVAGCASAGPGNSIIGGLDDAAPSDSRDLPEVDARGVDASPRQVTLDQTTSSAIRGGNSFACVEDPVPPALPKRTPANSYYRVFSLADSNVTSTLHVSEVVFGVEFARAASGGMQPATLKLGSYGATPTGDTLDPTKITNLATVPIQINDTLVGDRVTVPIGADIPPATQLVVELDLPINETAYHQFYIGSNGSGERKPGYWGATECNLARPQAFASMLDLPHEVDILMTVTGSM